MDHSNRSPSPEYTLLTSPCLQSEYYPQLDDPQNYLYPPQQHHQQQETEMLQLPSHHHKLQVVSGGISGGSDDSERSNPFSTHCKIPLPNSFSSYDYWMEPSFIRRRNERERQRVRNVNDGFERLRSHLPLSEKERDKRLSKVETLRVAIGYIQHLQNLLKECGKNKN